VFKRGGVFAAARIAWLADGKAGLSFYRELSESELDSAFNSVAADSCPTTRSNHDHAEPPTSQTKRTLRA
jgi:hypothetical protein